MCHLIGDFHLIPKLVDEPGFTVVGISSGASNGEEMSGKGVIPQQWDRSIKEGMLGQIPNKVDSNILAVYTDYESDANGEYTFLLGLRLSAVDHVALGMVPMEVPRGG